MVCDTLCLAAPICEAQLPLGQVLGIVQEHARHMLDPSLRGNCVRACGGPVRDCKGGFYLGSVTWAVCTSAAIMGSKATAFSPLAGA